MQIALNTAILLLGSLAYLTNDCVVEFLDSSLSSKVLFAVVLSLPLFVCVSGYAKLKPLLRVIQIAAIKILWFLFMGTRDTLTLLLFTIKRATSNEKIFNDVVTSLENRNILPDYVLTCNATACGLDINSFAQAPGAQADGLLKEVPEYLSSNLLGLISLILIAGAATCTGISCAALYSYLFSSAPNQQNYAVITDELHRISTVVQENRSAINAAADLILPMSTDISVVHSQLSRNLSHVKELKKGLETVSETLAELNSLAGATTTASKSILDLGLITEENAGQLRRLQLQVARNVVMLHNHEIWLRSI